MIVWTISGQFSLKLWKDTKREIIGKHVLVTMSQSKHALYLRDLFAWHFPKMGDASLSKLLNLSERFTIVRLWVTFHLQEKKMKELMDKLGFVQTFLFLRRFLFLVFSSVSLFFYVSATALNMSAMLEITVCCDLMRVWRVKARVCQVFEVSQKEISNLSLPSGGYLPIARSTYQTFLKLMPLVHFKMISDFIFRPKYSPWISRLQSLLDRCFQRLGVFTESLEKFECTDG